MSATETRRISQNEVRATVVQANAQLYSRVFEISEELGRLKAISDISSTLINKENKGMSSV